MTLRSSAVKNLPAAEAVALTIHRTSPGPDHGDVAANTEAIDEGKGASLAMTEQAGATVDATIASFTAPRAGTILGVYTKLGTACGGAETVDVDVQIGGVTALTALIALAAGDGTNSKAGTLAGAGAADFVAGQVITVVIDQTTGGADTAADLSTCIAWRLT